MQNWALATLLLMLVASTGCQSSGGSRWAFLNPFSGDDDKKLVAATAPELPSSGSGLPSDGVTAQLEGAPAATTVASTQPAATTAPKEPSMEAPTYAANTPAFDSSPAKEESRIATTPQLAKSVPEPPTSHSYPMAAIPDMETPEPVVAQANPYDPNGYQEAALAQVAAAPSAPADRYGNLGNRYASAPTATPSNDTPDFRYQPTETPAQSTTGDRYGSYASTPAPTSAPASAATPSSTPYQPAETAQVVTTPAGSRYASTPAPHAVTPATTPIVSPYTTSQQPSAPLVAEVNTPSSEVKLVSAPGQYRPGGTSSYGSQMGIATKPEPYIDSSTPSQFRR